MKITLLLEYEIRVLKGNIAMKKNNIKKVAVLSLVGVMGLTMFSGCGKKDNNASARKVVEYDINDYVKTLGTYTGLSVDENIKIVTDDDVQSQLDSLVSNNTKYNDITDRNAQSGDRVKIDYIKSQAGKDDETKTDYTVDLGSGNMGEEFENKLVGLAINGSITFTVQEDASTESGTDENTEAEKVDVTYTVTLKSIQEKVVPEVTDAFIAEKTDYDTLDAYKEGTKKKLEENNADSAKTTAESELINKVVEASEVTGCPAFVYNMNYNALCQSYKTYASYFGATLESYLSAAGSSLKDLQKQAVNMTKQTLVLEALVKDAGIDITDDNYDEKLKEYVEKYNLGTVEDVSSKYTKEELLFDMRRDAATDYLYTNNTVTKKMVSATN